MSPRASSAKGHHVASAPKLGLTTITLSRSRGPGCPPQEFKLTTTGSVRILRRRMPQSNEFVVVLDKPFFSTAGQSLASTSTHSPSLPSGQGSLISSTHAGCSNADSEPRLCTPPPVYAATPFYPQTHLELDPATDPSAVTFLDLLPPRFPEPMPARTFDGILEQGNDNEGRPLRGLRDPNLHRLPSTWHYEAENSNTHGDGNEELAYRLSKRRIPRSHIVMPLIAIVLVLGALAVWTISAVTSRT